MYTRHQILRVIEEDLRAGEQHVCIFAVFSDVTKMGCALQARCVIVLASCFRHQMPTLHLYNRADFRVNKL